MSPCPLCNYSSDDDYILALHVEEQHFADESPFVVKENLPVTETGRSDDEDVWVPCGEEGCGEQVLWSDLQEHLDFHIAEYLELSDSAEAITTQKLPTVDQPSSKANAKREISRTASVSTSGSNKRWCRLGTKELGPYAHEAKMPKSLWQQLEKGAKTETVQRISQNGKLYRTISVENEISGIISILSRLLEVDPSVEKAYLCHPAVKHVFKTKNEGGFCGYRNLQMMFSYLLGAAHPSSKEVSQLMKESWRGSERIPNVIDLQQAIETAWDQGFQTIGRVETGGIYGTRKYIGTPEANALLESMSINHHAECFSDISSSSSFKPAYKSLLDRVYVYFTQFQPHDYDKVIKTQLPPIYLQQPGHSLTIVGIEQQKGGELGLLVFDPAFKPSRGMYKLLSQPPPRPTLSDQGSVRSSRSNSYASMKRTQSNTTGENANRSTELPSAMHNQMPVRGGYMAMPSGPASSIDEDSSLKSYMDVLKPSISSAARREAQLSIKSGTASKLLEAYRRGRSKLSRHQQFEICILDVDDTAYEV